MSNTPKHVTHTFSPIYDRNSKILILGTFPSVKSREGDFYYHHPQNRFWKILSRIFGVDVPQTIEDKKEMLLKNQTAIWDVIASCEITGSSDSSIKNVIPADIERVLKNSSIEKIYANGNKAYELYMKYCFPDTGREIIKLPSTSPANAAFSLDKLIEIWKKEITPALNISANSETRFLTLNELCQELSISVATGKNWLKSGRLTVDSYERQTPLFSQEYIRSYKKMLQRNEQTVLKSRRNKNYISGNGFYDSYLPANSPNVKNVKTLLERIDTYHYPTDETGIGLVLAKCAMQLYKQCNYVNHTLIDDLIKNTALAKKLTEKYPEIFSIEYTYVPQEDLLGLLYLSMRNIGNRKTNGAYYTPATVVRQLLDNLPTPHPDDTLLDPCCGTGNFLLQLSSHWTPEQLYASDIDEISVAVTRINLSLKFPACSTEFLCKHIQCRNFLTTRQSQGYNYIIGNPPWGFTYSDEEKCSLQRNFVSAGKNPESYDLFIEKALKNLSKNGTLAFVLPEAMLNVRSHKPIRQIICDSCDVKALTYLGNIFDGVWCPSVTLQLVKTNKPISVIGACITTEKLTFTIEKNRPITADNFQLAVTDEEYALLQKIETLEYADTLKGNADFGLGIVTGDNKQYLIPSEKIAVAYDTDNSDTIIKRTPEPILKGNDIEPYHIKPAKNYVNFQPEHFQQCAPVNLYRAPEKLVYRFIGNKLIFAYDDKQHISLNSCNILIPHIEGLHIKYILTILNSRIARFFVQKKWNSLKVLRSHLEQIPIPVISTDKQQYFIDMADSLMQVQSGTDSQPFDSVDIISKAITFDTLYNKLDKAIADLYGLTDEEYQLITSSFE